MHAIKFLYQYCKFQSRNLISHEARCCAWVFFFFSFLFCLSSLSLIPFSLGASFFALLPLGPVGRVAPEKKKSTWKTKFLCRA